jgi:hypothetical protein
MTTVPKRLSAADAALVKGMLARGDRQSDVAAYFKVNAGRVSEVNTGKSHRYVAAAPAHLLPPPGPYDVQLGRAA